MPQTIMLSGLRHFFYLLTLLSVGEQERSIAQRIDGKTVFCPMRLGREFREAANENRLLFGPHPVRGIRMEVYPAGLHIHLRPNTNAIRWAGMRVELLSGDECQYHRRRDGLHAALPHDAIQVALAGALGIEVYYSIPFCRQLVSHMTHTLPSD